MIINISEDKEKRCYNEANGFHNSYGSDETRSDGYKSYCINGKCHNPYGPAIIYPDGHKEYFLDNIRRIKIEWEKLRHDY